MVVELKENKQEVTFEVGDLIVLTNGEKFLVIKDADACDYRILNLRTLTPSSFFSSRSGVLAYIKGGYPDSPIERIVPANNVKLVER